MERIACIPARGLGEKVDLRMKCTFSTAGKRAGEGRDTWMGIARGEKKAVY
jgi:hypothetical protein